MNSKSHSDSRSKLNDKGCENSRGNGGVNSGNSKKPSSLMEAFGDYTRSRSSRPELNPTSILHTIRRKSNKIKRDADDDD